MLRAATLVSLWCLLAPALLVGQQPPAEPADRAPAQTPAAEPEAPLTEAERIVRLRRTIEENEKRLKELRDKLNDPQGEYFLAEAEFQALDEELKSKTRALEKLKAEGKADQAAALQADVDALTQRWTLAKERFDLAIRERKTLQEQVVTLEQKNAQDREALNKLLALPTTQPTVGPAPAGPATGPVEPPPGATEAAHPAATQPAPATPVATNGPPAVPAAAPAEAPAAAPAQPAPAEPAKPPSKELLKAQEEAQAKQEKAQAAEEEVRSLSERIEQVRKQIEQERQELRILRQKVDNADETRRTLYDLVQKRSSEGAPREELNELWAEIGDARQRARQARAELDKKVERIDQLQDELQTLQAEHIAALEEAEELRREAERAQQAVERLKNPFSPQNILQWILTHGPRLVAIVVGMIVLLWLARFAEQRFVRFIVGRGGPGTELERENRAKTLMGVFHHAATLLIVVGGLLMIVRELGFDVVPVLGAAGVLGLAVAFGAQNLVRDYFAGFMILLENQYGINDVIKIGDVGGLVEKITLRITMLRGLDGTVHFIPNGQIDKVSNMTHGWSRALFNIGVAYKEDVDRVMDLLVELGKELRADPRFGHLILDDPEMLGVDEFADSAVVVRFFIKTRPLQQWTVKREMLRRIKKKFDELGIEIPFPHRTIFHRHEHVEVHPAGKGTGAGHELLDQSGGRR